MKKYGVYGLIDFFKIDYHSILVLLNIGRRNMEWLLNIYFYTCMLLRLALLSDGVSFGIWDVE